MKDQGRPEAAHGAAANKSTASRPTEPFEDFNRLLARYTPAFRCLVDARCESTAGDWALLGLECRDQSDAYVYEPLAPEPRSLRRVDQGTPTSTSTSTSAGRVQFEHDDPLRRIPATEYLPVIAGVEVSSNGRCRCPMPDHEDLHPSAKAYGAWWHCFACGAGGSIIDVAAAIYGIQASGPDYWRLRDRILEALVWSPLRHEATP